MRIAIDISQIVYATGVSTYTKELVRNLVKIDKVNSYLLFGGSLRRREELRSFVDSVTCDNVSGLILPIAPTLGDILWNRLHMYSLDRVLGKVDVFHSSDWTEPNTSAYKVTTIHDLAFIKYPELTHKKIQDVQKRRLELVKREVNKIIVPSNQVRQDLREYGFDIRKVSVVNEAASTQFKRVTRKMALGTLEKYKINKYILCVGVNPRKNVQRSIEAFRKLKLTDYKLVLVGQPHGIDILENDDVCLTGHVTDSELSVLYSHAEVFLYPSLYEGFGIPILDAFKIGVPVVTSNVGCMKEIAGNAAVLVDPHSVGGIAEGIKKAMKDKSTYIQKGQIREKSYSWEKMARETLEIYMGANRK